MASFNKVILLGNLTRDPEVRSTPAGQSVTALGIATNRSFTSGGRDGQGGEKREEVTFVDVDFWGRTGELIAQYLRKGDPIFIEGRLHFRQWEDKEGGKRSKLSVTGENFQFIGGKRGEGGGGGPPGGGGGRGAPMRESSGEAAPQSGGEMEAGFDEVPF